MAIPWVIGRHRTVDDPYIKCFMRDFYYDVRTKARLKERRKRRLKLSLSLSFFFLPFLSFAFFSWRFIV